MAAFPGDPLARPVRVDCAISASGAIEAARDELVGKTVVCSLEGNSHDSEPKHVEEALSERLGIRDRRFQVLKHFPEQYLIIFSSSHDQQLVLHRSRINHRGRVFTFEAWNEQRYGSVTRWGFHLRLRLEGIPVHAWNEKVAALLIGSHCATHFVEEESSFRRRTRTFDLWAWCSDPCLVPREAWLTITDPDSGVAVHPVRPVGIKHGLLYKVLIHMEVIEDLSFSLGGGGGPGRKRRRVMEWHYGVPDHLGERRERGRQLERGNRSWRQGATMTMSRTVMEVAVTVVALCGIECPVAMVRSTTATPPLIARGSGLALLHNIIASMLFIILPGAKVLSCPTPSWCGAPSVSLTRRSPLPSPWCTLLRRRLQHTLLLSSSKVLFLIFVCLILGMLFLMFQIGLTQ
jgi:hypothetical protein